MRDLVGIYLCLAPGPPQGAGRAPQTEPNPTAAAVMSEAPPTLPDLPDDALLLIANHDLLSALSLRSTCDSMHKRLLEVGKKITEKRKADAGRSRAEMSLVAMSCKSEIDRAAERAIARMAAVGYPNQAERVIARMAAVGIQPPPMHGGAVAAVASSAAGAAEAASASAAYIAAVHQPAPPPAEVVPPAAAVGAAAVGAAAAAAAPAGAAAAAVAPTRRRSTFSGLVSKLKVKDVR